MQAGARDKVELTILPDAELIVMGGMPLMGLVSVGDIVETEGSYYEKGKLEAVELRITLTKPVTPPPSKGPKVAPKNLPPRKRNPTSKKNLPTIQCRQPMLQTMPPTNNRCFSCQKLVVLRLERRHSTIQPTIGCHIAVRDFEGLRKAYR